MRPYQGSFKFSYATVQNGLSMINRYTLQFGAIERYEHNVYGIQQFDIDGPSFKRDYIYDICCRVWEDQMQKYCSNKIPQHSNI